MVLCLGWRIKEEQKTRRGCSMAEVAVCLFAQTRRGKIPMRKKRRLRFLEALLEFTFAMMLSMVTSLSAPPGKTSERHLANTIVRAG